MPGICLTPGKVKAYTDGRSLPEEGVPKAGGLASLLHELRFYSGEASPTPVCEDSVMRLNFRCRRCRSPLSIQAEQTWKTVFCPSRQGEFLPPTCSADILPRGRRP